MRNCSRIWNPRGTANAVQAIGDEVRGNGRGILFGVLGVEAHRLGAGVPQNDLPVIPERLEIDASFGHVV